MITQQRIEQIIQVVAITILVIGCLMVLRPFLAAVLTAAILCYSTWPVYAFLERTAGGRRWLAALAMTALLILVLVIPLAVIAVSYADDVPRLIESAREMIADGLPGPPAWVASIPLLGESLDAGWREIVGSQANLVEALKRLAQPAREVAVRTGILIGEGVLEFTLIAFIGYFFYRDGAALIGALRRGLDRVAGHLAGRLLEIVGGTINGVIYGIVGTGIAQAIAAVVGFVIAGVPGALMLGFVTFFLSIVPAGPALIWVGAAVWLFYQDQTGWAVFMALWGFFVISGIDNIVKPLLISRGASLPFALVLLGVLGGVLAFGFVGIFLGPVLLAVGFNLVRSWTQARGLAADALSEPPRG
ncbi:MAG: AI-2E family transporter [Betaproteobacteria bacterium]|nr:AI-2E family transporter [Betaproteobacteria bacterium]